MTKFRVGEAVSNQDIIREFRVANMGRMRRSKSTKSLILISDHTRGPYEARLDGETIYYKLSYRQNKTLYFAALNGISVHLFEVFQPNNYIYRGVVYLAGKPFTERQVGEDGFERDVLIFPLKLKQ